MNLIKLISLLVSTLLFNGCAFIHSLDQNLPQQVDEWMQNKEYAKVIDTLAYIHSDHPQYKRLAPIRELAAQKALEYETYILTRGKEFLEKQQWQQAYITYDRGLDKLPDSAAIQQAMHEFIQQRDTYIRQLSYKILFNKGQAILANTPIQDKINTAAPDNYRYRAQAKQHESERIEIAVELLDCAEYGLKANQLVTSQNCLDLAGKLAGSPASKRHVEIQRKLKAKRKSLSQHLSGTAQLNLQLAKDALKDNKLRDAVDLMKKIPAEEQEKPAVLKFKENLYIEIKKTVKSGAIEGRKLYSTGKIAEALEIWRALLVLDPENIALQKHIDRAERVLTKLKTLSTPTPTKE